MGIHKIVCPTGYKKIANNTCLKIIVKYKLVCPTGYKLRNGKCYKHTVIIKYENPTPDPKESRIQCIIRYSKMIKRLTDQKARLNHEYTENLIDGKSNTKTQTQLDRTNLLVETWVQGLNDC